jgi:hypothetical protein
LDTFLPIAAQALPVDAAPRARAQAEIHRFGFGIHLEQLDVDPTSAFTVLLNGVGPRVSISRAAADLAEGTVKTEATTRQRFVNEIATSSAFADINDILSFDKSTSISFDLALEGQLFVDGEDDSAFYQSFVRFFDVTDVATIYDEDELSLDTLTSEIHDSRTAGLIQYRGSDVSTNYSQEIIDLFGIDFYLDPITDGTPLIVDQTITGEIDVVAGREYLILIEGLSIAADRGLLNTAYSDFFNTASFNFTDLGGANLTSLSGVFPGSEVPTAQVPEPSSLGLLTASVIAFLWARRSRRKGG